MEETLQLEQWQITPVFLEREVNFLVFDRNGYCCRFVPGFAGFELSPLDHALGNDPGAGSIAKIGTYIHRYFL